MKPLPWLRVVDVRWVLRVTLPLLTVFALVVIVVSGVSRLAYEGQFVNLLRPTHIATLVGGIELGQTFVAPRDGLNRVDVLVYGSFRPNTQPVTFHLRRDGAAEDEVTSTFNAGEVWGWRWMSFRFDPLADSKGQAYVLFFGSPTSTPDDGLTLGGVEGDLYPNGTALINGRPIRADAAFMTYYDGVSWEETATALMARLTGAKPSIWGDIRLYALLAVIYLLLVLRLLRAVYRLRR